MCVCCKFFLRYRYIYIKCVSARSSVSLFMFILNSVTIALFSLLCKTVMPEDVSADMRISFSFFPFSSSLPSQYSYSASHDRRDDDEVSVEE